ncbi:MAG TPA: EcsC family protein, partial [Baekduia sp.]|nr:EcsC family protein [Baekduia sp.]
TARYSYDGPELARMATSKHASMARFGGAAMGFGGMLTILPDIAALAWIQSRLIFYIAAAYGFDPTDPMRPAELLVLQGLYPEPLAARRALDGEGPMIAEALIGKAMSRDQAIVERLMRMVGAKGAKKLAGKAIPGFAIAFNAYSNERETRRLANKAMSFYGG